MVISPTSSKSSLRSLARTSAVWTPRRSSRSRVSPNRAPRGTAIVSTASPRAGARPRFGIARPGLGEGDVQALDVQRPADGRQLAPEAPDQLVVAPATAQRPTERRVVDLEDRPGVVAEV